LTHHKCDGSLAVCEQNQKKARFDLLACFCACVVIRLARDPSHDWPHQNTPHRTRMFETSSLCPCLHLGAVRRLHHPSLSFSCGCASAGSCSCRRPTCPRATTPPPLCAGALAPSSASLPSTNHLRTSEKVVAPDRGCTDVQRRAHTHKKSKNRRTQHNTHQHTHITNQRPRISRSVAFCNAVVERRLVACTYVVGGGRPSRGHPSAPNSHLSTSASTNFFAASQHHALAGQQAAKSKSQARCFRCLRILLLFFLLLFCRRRCVCVCVFPCFVCDAVLDGDAHTSMATLLLAQSLPCLLACLLACSSAHSHRVHISHNLLCITAAAKPEHTMDISPEDKPWKLTISCFLRNNPVYQKGIDYVFDGKTVRSTCPLN
jgi:hypothetical protein